MFFSHSYSHYLEIPFFNKQDFVLCYFYQLACCQFWFCFLRNSIFPNGGGWLCPHFFQALAGSFNHPPPTPKLNTSRRPPLLGLIWPEKKYLTSSEVVSPFFILCTPAASELNFPIIMWNKNAKIFTFVTLLPVSRISNIIMRAVMRRTMGMVVLMVAVQTRS